MNLLERYEAHDRALVKAGWHATSPWWLRELDRFLGGSCKRWVVRAGRRAGKSQTMCRLAVAVALDDEWRSSIGPGDRGVIPFVSVNRGEASQRLFTIAQILRALRVPFEERGDEIELKDRPVVFRVVTCSTDAVVGFTSIAIFADEVARWEAGHDAANPAAQVMASLTPTTATVPSAIECLVSSPWALDDYHAQEFERGNTDDQAVSHGASWECNPTITEAWTHTKQRDPVAWRREYAAIPGSLDTSAFAAEDVDAAFASRAEPDPSAERILCVDPSKLRHDDYAYAVVTTARDGSVVVLEVGGISPPATVPQAIARIVEVAERHGVRRIFADDLATGHESDYARHGLEYCAHPWTGPSKHEAGAILRRLISERSIALPMHDRLRSELLNQTARLRPANSQVVYETNGRDYISTLFVLADAVARADFSIEIRQCAMPTSDETNEVYDELEADALRRLAAEVGPIEIDPVEGLNERMWQRHREHVYAKAGVIRREPATMFGEVMAPEEEGADLSTPAGRAVMASFASIMRGNR